MIHLERVLVVVEQRDQLGGRFAAFDLWKWGSCKL